MAEAQVIKLGTLNDVAPGATIHSRWNNASAEVYCLNAWPKVAPGVAASAEITKAMARVHGSPREPELHYYVKNTGTTTIDIEIWASYWDWSLSPWLEAVREEFKVPAVGGAIVTTRGIDTSGVAGIRKHGDSTAVQLNDRWHLGSDTKAMTGTLAGVLAQKGVIGWDMTLAEAFPEWADSMNSNLKDATLERLMAHRSGIVNLTSEESAALADTAKTVSERRREFARLVMHREHGSDDILFDAPGFIFLYRNENFILAGAMLERCTGKSWEQLMQDELFGPLGMTTAGFGAPGSQNDVKEPYGHSDASGERVPNKGDNTPTLGPAGTVHASLGDWAKFIRLHLDGSENSLKLSQPTFDRLHTEFPPNSIYNAKYGWGWIFFDNSGDIGLGHDGSNGSWYCSCQVLPQDGVAFLAVSNIGGGVNGNGDEACGRVIQELRGHYLGG